MRIFFTALVLVLASGCATQPKAPITLDEVYARGIQGPLGFRLGTVLSVSGRIIANSSLAKADVSEPFFVRVESVNGKRLDSPVDYPARDFQLVDQVKPLKIGDEFSCTGFETGRYNDFVDNPSGPAFAHPGYGFVVYFHVFSV